MSVKAAATKVSQPKIQVIKIQKFNLAIKKFNKARTNLPDIRQIQSQEQTTR